MSSIFGLVDNTFTVCLRRFRWFHAGVSIITLLMTARDTKNPNCNCLHNVAFRICHSAWVVTLGGIFEKFAMYLGLCVCVCVSVGVCACV